MLGTAWPKSRCRATTDEVTCQLGASVLKVDAGCWHAVKMLKAWQFCLSPNRQTLRAEHRGMEDSHERTGVLRRLIWSTYAVLLSGCALPVAGLISERWASCVFERQASPSRSCLGADCMGMRARQLVGVMRPGGNWSMSERDAFLFWILINLSKDCSETPTSAQGHFWSHKFKTMGIAPAQVI